MHGIMVSTDSCFRSVYNVTSVPSAGVFDQTECNLAMSPQTAASGVCTM